MNITAMSPLPARPMPDRRFAYVLCLAGLLLIIFSVSESYARWSLTITGRITSSDTTCQQPSNTRCVSLYLIATPDGSIVRHHADFDDASLPTGLPLGTVLQKARGTFSYRRNGITVHDYPVIGYSVFALGGLAFIFTGFFLARKRPPRPNPGMQRTRFARP